MFFVGMNLIICVRIIPTNIKPIESVQSAESRFAPIALLESTMGIYVSVVNRNPRLIITKKVPKAHHLKLKLPLKNPMRVLTILTMIRFLCVNDAFNSIAVTALLLKKGKRFV